MVDAATLERARSVAEHDEAAEQRDDHARRRDLAAKARDRAAAERDRAEELSEHVLSRNGGDPQARAAAFRARAAVDRELAARDRVAASQDRREAARDREEARAMLERAELDDLTGVYRRSTGAVALKNEMDRARRSESPLVLAFVDVDDLKRVNDERGHAAGDAVLRAVTGALRSRLRSYDPIVRYGGDEFVCALSDTSMDQARARFEEISLELAEADGGASISVGLAALRADDTLDELMARGDAALHEVRAGT